MDGWMDGCMDVWMGWMYGRDGQMAGMDGMYEYVCNVLFIF